MRLHKLKYLDYIFRTAIEEVSGNRVALGGTRMGKIEGQIQKRRLHIERWLISEAVCHVLLLIFAVFLGLPLISNYFPGGEDCIPGTCVWMEIYMPATGVGQWLTGSWCLWCQYLN